MKRALRFAPAAVVVLLVSALSIGQQYRSDVSSRYVDAATAGAQGGAAAGAGGGGSIAGGGAEGAGAGAGALAPVGGLSCERGRNGGATDTGVTSTSITLGATVVKSGIGQSFLGQVPVALEAVKNKVNRGGGICGRLLKLKMVDDGWEAARGQQFIRNFINEGVFALAVSPSSEGLDAAIRNGDIRRAGIPVVGADGMLISQYTEPWVWPVAASTMTTMHVMAKNAFERGARTFGLVYDKSYHFGVEGAAAFRGALRRLFPRGGALKQDVGVEADQTSYKNEVDTFNGGCDPCDFVAMLLEPPTALQWIRDGASFGSVGTGGPQPLFVNSFAHGCGSPCNGMWVWTGYVPPVDPFDGLPAVARYVSDVRLQMSSTDVSNPFVEGGYLGMELLVRALRAVGPSVTRQRLRLALNGMTLDSGLTVPLRWTEGNHYANNAVQAFSIVVNSGSFSGWRYERTGWITDPWVGMDAPRR